MAGTFKLIKRIRNSPYVEEMKKQAVSAKKWEILVSGGIILILCLSAFADARGALTLTKARNYSVVVRFNSSVASSTTSTLRYSSVSLSPAQIREWNNRHSSLQSWGAQGGFDECKRVTRKIFGLPGPSDVTYLPGGGFSVQCFQDKGGYLDVSGDVFQFQAYDDKTASYVTLNASRLRIVPRNRTRFLAGGIW